MMIDQLYANNISIISISLCFAQHGCKADIVVKFWQPLCGDRKHHPLIVDSFGPYGEGGGGLIAGWGQLIWRKCPPPTPPAHRPCQCVPNLFYNPTTLTASFLALSQKEDGKCLRPKVCGSLLIHCNHKRSENCLKWSNFGRLILNFGYANVIAMRNMRQKHVVYNYNACPAQRSPQYSTVQYSTVHHSTLGH